MSHLVVMLRNSCAKLLKSKDTERYAHDITVLTFFRIRVLLVLTDPIPSMHLRANGNGFVIFHKGLCVCLSVFACVCSLCNFVGSLVCVTHGVCVHLCRSLTLALLLNFRV